MKRRDFMKWAVGGAASGFCSMPVLAAEPHAISIESRILEVNGKAAKVFGLMVDGRPGGLRTRFGRPFDVTIHNGTDEETLLHWHGLTPPLQFDGVPGLSAPPLKPGERTRYTFENRRTGTHWMHSHVGLQEQRLLAAPLIVEEDGEPLQDEQDHVVMLHDFTFRDPQDILAELQGGGGLHAGHMGHGTGTAAQGMDHSSHGAGGMSMAGPSGMASDVAFDAMLANDRTVDDPEVIKAEKGGRFRLRIINGAAATNVWIDLGQLEGDLIAVDGNAIEPVRGSVFPLAIAQRADIRLALPPGSGSWPVRFRQEGGMQESAIILSAGDGQAAKLAPSGQASAFLDLAFERRLKSVAGLADDPVVRAEMVMLTGGGADYAWGFNGQSMMHDVLFHVREGSRYEIMMHNMTSMAHPMHLHGHYFRVVGIDGERFQGAMRDTVLVPPDRMVTIQFDADNPGTWAFHCHHLYHMNAGMMATVSYSGAA